MRHRSKITIPKEPEQIIREALKREEAVRKHREDEAVILEPYTEPPQVLPTYHREKVDYWEIIRSKLTIRPYLP